MEGNQQKMRDAVVQALRKLQELCVASYEDENLRDDCERLLRSAIAAPPRNCDEYDCKSDAEVGFVKQTGETDESPLYWQLFANWLFATAEERKGEGDGK